MQPRHESPAAAGLLLALAVAPALPVPAALAVLVLALAGWVALRPPVRDLAIIGAGVLVAFLALLLGGRAAGGPDLDDADWRAATRRGYAAAWQSLDAEAERVAAVLAEHGLSREVRSEEQRLAAVRALADLTPSGKDSRAGRQVLMLVDPDGEPVAWAGEGLLHELRPEDVPASGRTFEASFGAVTLLSVRPLGDERRPWRAVAARSHPTDRLPFAPDLPFFLDGGPGAGAEGNGGVRWALVQKAADAVPTAVVLEPLRAGASSARAGGGEDGRPVVEPVVEAGDGQTPAAVPAEPRETRATAPISGEDGDTGSGVGSGAEVAGTPLLVLERDVLRGSPDILRRARRVAWAGLGLALLLLVAMRGTGMALARAAAGAAVTGRPASSHGIDVEETAPPAGASGPVLAVVGIGAAIAVARAFGAETAALAALALGLGVAVLGVGLGRRGFGPGGRGPGRPRSLGVVATAGALGVVLLVLLAGAAQWQGVVFDPLSTLATDASQYVLRLALAAAAVGVLVLAAGGLGQGPSGGPATGSGAAGAVPPSGRGGAGGFGEPGEVWGWVALVPLLAGAAAVDRPWLALPLFVVSGALFALWLQRRRRSAAILALLVVLGSVLAAGVWETVHRELLRRDLAMRVLPDLGPPTAAERQALDERVNAFFTGADLERFVPRAPEGLGREDLAFLLWQASPLARPRAFSRLSVQPLEEGLPSSFSFGVPTDEAGRVERDPARWQGRLPVPADERLVQGSAFLRYRGRTWALVRWSVLPLPGFRFSGGAELENVEAALLRGLPGGAAESGLPGEAAFVAYDARGRPFAAPWPEEPRLPPALAVGTRPAEGGAGLSAGAQRADALPVRVEARVATPSGPAWAVARATGLDAAGAATGWEVLYLPRLVPRAAVERVGTRALELLMAVAAAALLALLVALPRLDFRARLRRAVRSYSKRLLLVYTVLLLVPLLLLNVVLVAAVENRLRKEQRANGEAALATAQKVVGDYLASVEPGFDLANVLDDELLLWISEVLRHEINLYWGSEVWASSKPELFTARLLPKRIPGESFARIAFLGNDLAARTNRVGDVSYLELYAPLRVAGAETEAPNFFLSMPLLAQQEEVAGELATLRRQAFLVTVVLILLVSAVGVRLSQSFTRPLTELVEGTRRIAAGAPSLDLSPSELELAALVEAVDEMARRIAVGRERLVREKQVVERMVQHITSGIVSLDQDRKVLMRNRVAAELLGVEVGERLEEALRRHRRLAGLAPWVATADRELAQRTIRLPATGLDGPAEDGPAEDRTVEDGTGESAAAEESGEREWTLVWVPVPGTGEPAALLVVEDVTETLRSQRLEAWAEMARIIAHEIKNPLTPIRLNIEHVQQVWRDQRQRGALDERFDQVLERCTENVLTQVDELREIASEFSTYSRIPKIEPRRGDLVEAMAELAEPYRTAPPPGVEVALEAPEGPIPARFDRRLLARAVRNLVENALRASAGGGRVVLRVERTSPAEARIAVLDCGSGIDPGLLQRIFDPYFSTYDTGTGLGLPIARRIAEEHGGTIAARNRPGGGLEVAITLPAE